MPELGDWRIPEVKGANFRDGHLLLDPYAGFDYQAYPDVRSSAGTGGSRMANESPAALPQEIYDVGDDELSTGEFPGSEGWQSERTRSQQVSLLLSKQEPTEAYQIDGGTRNLKSKT